jgi:hypothetical protein
LRKAIACAQWRASHGGNIRNIRHLARMERRSAHAANRQRDQRSAQPHGSARFSGWWA